MAGHPSRRRGAKALALLAALAAALAVALAPAAARADEAMTVYRLYNQWSGEHLFTTDASEYASLGKIGWTQEGEA